jgi:hypothetical protein
MMSRVRAVQQPVQVLASSPSSSTLLIVSIGSLACTFLGWYHMLPFSPFSFISFDRTGPSFKRGPPKGYIHAIEQRWHQVESVLGAILSSKDPHVQALINNLRKDKLARDILSRVDSGPFVSISCYSIRTIGLLNNSAVQGPTGRLNLSSAMTKEDFFASIMESDALHPRDPSRPKRQSRMSREIVSSSM